MKATCKVVIKEYAPSQTLLLSLSLEEIIEENHLVRLEQPFFILQNRIRLRRKYSPDVAQWYEPP